MGSAPRFPRKPSLFLLFQPFKEKIIRIEKVERFQAGLSEEVAEDKPSFDASSFIPEMGICGMPVNPDKLFVFVLVFRHILMDVVNSVTPVGPVAQKNHLAVGMGFGVLP